MRSKREINADLDRAFQWLCSADVISSINGTLRTLKRLSNHLEKTSFEGMKPDVAAKTAMNLVKAADELTRLMALVQGQPDQRTEVTGLADLLKVLDNEKFEQVSQWIDEGMKRLEQPANSTPA